MQQLNLLELFIVGTCSFHFATTVIQSLDDDLLKAPSDVNVGYLKVFSSHTILPIPSDLLEWALHVAAMTEAQLVVMGHGKDPSPFVYLNSRTPYLRRRI